ncbi:MAG: glycoside hydrolase family 2 [Bacilli bacterium]
MDKIAEIFAGKYDNHVMPLFWQKGESKESIEEYIKAMKESDIHSFIVESRPFPDFCGDKWWKLMDNIIALANQYDMTVWIFDDSHFPTGYANGIVEKFPQYGKKVLKHRIINVNGPLKGCGIHKELPAEKDAELLGLVCQKDDQILQVEYELQDEILYLDIPNGNWNVELFYIGKETDYHKNHINIIDKEACNAFIKTIYEPHYQRYKEEFGNVIVGFFTDEPGFQNEKGVKNDSIIGKEMPLPWNNELKDRLQQKYGEKYLSMLHYLWGKREEEIDAQVKFTYMDIVTDLYKANFDENIGRWCRDHGVKHIGHIIEDRDANARLGGGCGNMFRAMYGQDMAGVDVVFNQMIPGLDEGYHTYPRGEWDNEFFHYALVKLATSLAHIDSKKKGETMAEVFGAYGWHEGIYLMKWITDHFINRGVNYFVPHAFSQAPFPDEDCPPHFYGQGHNPQFRYFSILMQYINKMSTLFSLGRANPQAAILYHGEAEWGGQFMFCQKPARILTQNQVQFDIVPTDVWRYPNQYDASFDTGLTINGYQYEYLIIPYCQYIAKELIDYIYETTTHVIFIDKLPKKIYDSVDEIDISRLNNVVVLSLTQLESYIFEKDLNRLHLNQKEKYLRFYDYQKDNQHYYHLFNENPKHSINIDIDIEELEKYKYKYRVDVLNNETYFFDRTLNLAPNESCVIVGSQQVVKTNDRKEYNNLITVESKVKVSFAEAKEYPNFSGVTEIDEFIDINKFVKPNFSGTVRYTMHFYLPQDVESMQIQLAQVYEIAEVFVDDNNIGTRIVEPYIFIANVLNEGEHTLTIDVTNTLDKKVKDLFSQNEAIRPTGLLKKPILKY